MNRVRVAAAILLLAMTFAGGYLAGRLSAPPQPFVRAPESDEEGALRREMVELSQAIDAARSRGDDAEAERLQPRYHEVTARLQALLRR